MTDKTEYEQMIERHARVIDPFAWEEEPSVDFLKRVTGLPKADAKKLWWNQQADRRDKAIALACATFDADEAAGWASVPEKATEEMVKAAVGDDAIAVGDGVAEDLNAALDKGRIRRTKQ